jgi:hypothetical protein
VTVAPCRCHVKGLGVLCAGRNTNLRQNYNIARNSFTGVRSRAGEYDNFPIV